MALRRKLAEEVLASVPEDKTVFRYFKDRYALQLLAYAAAEGRSLSELRRGRFRPLLQRPVIRHLLGGRGARGVDWDLLDSYFPSPTEDYGLSFGLWGEEDSKPGWYQTTRPGFNVVVQLNFPLAHDRAYRRYIQPGEEGPFEFSVHPIHGKDRHTLAWSRLDIDLKRGEALIEEIQSDWIRDATRAAEEALSFLASGELHRSVWDEEARGDALEVFRYVEHVLESHRKMWDQAMMAASLWLLREHLGIRRIYMHTHDSGCVLKHITHSRPPRSIYEQLPRQFCFERVGGLPRFLESDLPGTRGVSGYEFWHLRV
jgi:hypothetical protein